LHPESHAALATGGKGFEGSPAALGVLEPLSLNADHSKNAHSIIAKMTPKITFGLFHIGTCSAGASIVTIHN
jgi:hypothetical protein